VMDSAEERAALVELDAVIEAARGGVGIVGDSAAAEPAAHLLRQRLLVLGALATAMVLWASAFTGIRYALRDYHAGPLALLRLAVMAITMLAIATVSRGKAAWRFTAGEWLGLVGLGLTSMTIYQLGLMNGEQSLDAGTASLIINTSPIFTALLALWLLREHLGARGWIGVLLGFAGTALLVGGGGSGTHLQLGGLFVLVASLSQSVSFIIQKPLLERLGPLLVTTWMGVFGALCVLPYGPQLITEMRQASPAATLMGVALGLLPNAVGNLAWSYALARLPAGRASTALYFSAPIALAVSWLFLGEKPELMALIGGAVVITSVLLVNLRPRPATAD
jgi:drug/metabolite transporter (DMT)-like permease